jgi:hypothetical protein
MQLPFTIKFALPVLAGGLIVCASPLRAADTKKEEKPAEGSGTTLSDFKFGETIANEPVTQESVKGKVVVIEMWGIH